MKPRLTLIAPLLPALAFLHTSIDRSEPVASLPAARVPDLTRLHTSFPTLSAERLVTSSSDIVLGRVLSVEPFHFQAGWISRRVRLAVEDCWQGDAAGTVDVILHGGRLDGRTTVADESPEVAPGERWVLYLQSPAGLDGHILAGGLQSAARVEQTGDGVDVVGAGTVGGTLDELRARDRALSAPVGGEVHHHGIELREEIR